MPPALVNVLPSDTHPTPGWQLTELRKLSAVTLGLGCTDQAEPFQFSTRLCGWGPEPPLLNDPVEPTAQHCAAFTQEIPARIPGDVESGTEADTSVHEEPSQCCIRIPDADPVPSVVAPDAQQLVEEVQVRPLR